MDHDKEIRALSAETLATQLVLQQVLFRVGKVDPRIAAAIGQAFEDASALAENLAMEFGADGDPGHTVKALKVIEELRTAVAGEAKPKHGV
jgi:hypothetical protein